MEMGYCLDPEGNGVGLVGGNEARPSLSERGKDRQLKPSEIRDNMEKDEEEQPIQTWWRRIGANRSRSHFIVLFILFMSVIAGVLIVTTVFFLTGE
jgi:hypothetical protein